MIVSISHMKKKRERKSQRKVKRKESILVASYSPNLIITADRKKGSLNKGGSISAIRRKVAKEYEW